MGNQLYFPQENNVTYPFLVKFPTRRAYGLQILLDFAPWEVVVGWVCILNTIVLL
jgi:hypothetical protein